MFPTFLNPRATVSLKIEGLTITCLNKEYNHGEGRWEIAVPHFLNHIATIEIPGSGRIPIPNDVETIEIRARNGVRPDNPAHIVGGTFSRRNRSHNQQDYRWLTNFTNEDEIPHGTVSIISGSRPTITMLHIYKAIAYTRHVQEHCLRLADQEATCPIRDGIPQPLANNVAGRALDDIQESFGHSADISGLDIEGAQAEGASDGETVDITFSNGWHYEVPKAPLPQDVSIENREPDGTEVPDGAIVSTGEHHYGRGDFYHYYQVFNIEKAPFHLWAVDPPLPARTGDCNGVRVNLSNLDHLLPK